MFAFILGIPQEKDLKVISSLADAIKIEPFKPKNITYDAEGKVIAGSSNDDSEP